LLNLDDPPERTALAFALGTFIAFSPLLGLHMILGAFVALVWRLNKVALFAGVCLINPWTIAPFVAASWAIGNWFVATPPVELPQFTLSALAGAAFWEQIAEQWHQLLPFAVGAMILAVVGSLVSYPLMLYVLRSYRRKYPMLTALAIKKSLDERN